MSRVQSQRLCGSFCTGGERGVRAHQEHRVHPQLWASWGGRAASRGAAVRLGAAPGIRTQRIQPQPGCQNGNGTLMMLFGRSQDLRTLSDLRKTFTGVFTSMCGKKVAVIHTLVSSESACFEVRNLRSLPLAQCPKSVWFTKHRSILAMQPWFLADLKYASLVHLCIPRCFALCCQTQLYWQDNLLTTRELKIKILVGPKSIGK